MDEQIKTRIKWINLYLETKDAGYACLRCGISRKTLRKWHRRYLQEGEKGLIDQSKKPHFSPNKKINDEYIQWILELREQRNLGARRIQTELLRLHECTLSLATIHKVLTNVSYG